MEYNIRSTGVNVVVWVTLQLHWISLLYLGQTERKAFTYLRKRHLNIINVGFKFKNRQQGEEMVNTYLLTPWSRVPLEKLTSLCS
jgi:hypothetical protein